MVGAWTTLNLNLDGENGFTLSHIASADNLWMREVHVDWLEHTIYLHTRCSSIAVRERVVLHWMHGCVCIAAKSSLESQWRGVSPIARLSVLDRNTLFFGAFPLPTASGAPSVHCNQYKTEGERNTTL